MSFATQVKEELNAIAIKSNCCKKAYIFGIIMSAEIINDLISLKLTDTSTVEHFCYLLKTIYNIEPEKKEIKRGCFNAVELTFKSHKLQEFLYYTDDFSDLDESGETLESYLKCENCRTVFLRGAFCSCGTVSDPQKSYSFEIKLPNDTRAMLIHSILEENGQEAPGITQRKGSFGVFYRNESAIEYALSLCGATKTVFTFFNVHIEKDLRNLENRATNCVTRNISKSVDAATSQIYAIEALKSNGMFDELSDEIKLTAELRIENPDLSLGELAELHNPPISKSGLNHRISKIIDLAKKRNLI